MHMSVCACGYGESLLTSGERNIQKNTPNPFVSAQSDGMLYYNNLTFKEHFVQQVKLHDNSNLTGYVVGGSWLNLLKYWTARFNGCDDRLAWLLSEYGKPSQDSQFTNLQGNGWSNF